MDAIAAPLNVRRVLRANLIINRLHMLVNAIAIFALSYYRFTTLSRIIDTRETPLLPYLIIVLSEFVLTFLWILHQAYRWCPVARTVYPERLPEDEKLPPIDVFICTADPSKEPSMGVMNTVISAMALDYPPNKLAVYLSDDSSSSVTFNALREAWKFARFWVPFCRKYELKIRCPEAYFSAQETSAGERFIGTTEFAADSQMIEHKYSEFQQALEKNAVNTRGSVSKDHPATIEVMMDENRDSDLRDMPFLVYVAREKRPSHPHQFKAGALNVLLRVSALISHAPYFLVLDCDMYCYDPLSARLAMCFYLDHEISSKIGWVQFPQKFHNISEHDIYAGRLNHVWREGQGYDGLRGPKLYGCNFFMTRQAIYGTNKIKNDVDLNQLKKSFGSSNEFIKSIQNYKLQLREDRKLSNVLQKELQLLASCTYENDTEWGQEVGYKYFSVVEDGSTSLELHCNGWISVFIDPARPCFLGASPTNLNDLLVQQTRWSFGLMQIGLSIFSPLLYSPLRLSILQSMCYAAKIYDSLSSVPFYGLAVIPPICLLYGIPLYPKVSDPFFIAFAYIFLASQIKHVQEVLSYGDSIWSALYEQRIWMMKSGSSNFYALLKAILHKIGLHEADFNLTNKAVDDEQAKRHKLGVYDFQASTLLIAPLCSFYILNLACFIVGIQRIIQKGDEFVAQAALSLFGIVLNYHVLEGMALRKDNGCISAFAVQVGIVLSVILLFLGSLLLLY